MDNEHPSLPCDVTLDIPYPSVQPSSRRRDYAQAMLSNVGSPSSEMGAVSLYFYNSVILQHKNPALAECFHQIGLVEMHHLEIFCSLAFQMGLDPRLWSLHGQYNRYWSPSFNRYPRDPRPLVENSLQGELAAIEKYTRQANTISDSNIVENLNRIILDEQQHVKIFRHMLETL